ncbi:MAG: zinc ribbon domain-containing protein [Flavobacteriales bacterium]|nr:zinc ribbon domain-containing protein [Flavobacteriales bacterium]
MISAASKPRDVRIIELNHISCNGCENKNVLKLHCFTDYMYFFFIPVISGGKKAIITCSNCGKNYDVSKQSDNVKELAKLEKQNLRIPIWHFTGLGIILLFIASLIAYNIWDNKQDAMLVKDPKPGDFYEYSDGDGWYSSFKISRVDKDSIYAFFNRQFINKATSIYEIDEPDNYWPFEESLSRKELEQMYEDGDIYEIDRD